LRTLERQFQAAVTAALLAAPEGRRRSGSAADRLAEYLVDAALLGDPASIEMILSLLPERGRRVRVPASIIRALCTEQALAALSQGLSDPESMREQSSGKFSARGSEEGP
jgi:hypothetical protein